MFQAFLELRDGLWQALEGLRVQPEAGSALIFCPSFADGAEDLWFTPRKPPTSTSSTISTIDMKCIRYYIH